MGTEAGPDMRLPTRLDRYPAKMVSHLADRLIERYAAGARNVLDPFCGSGAVLVAARRRGIEVSGIDLNPIARLLSGVKLDGFHPQSALRIANDWIEEAQRTTRVLPVEWKRKNYWFSPATLNKFERLRRASGMIDLDRSKAGRAVLLSYVLATRPCSRADQRSPKPFISANARETRRGQHFDPYKTIIGILEELSGLYGKHKPRAGVKLMTGDLTVPSNMGERVGRHSHVITSPPYINAQDYFRNFKLELHLLDGIVPVRVADICDRFIGTERGDLFEGLSLGDIEQNRLDVRGLKKLEFEKPRLAAVVHRYCRDMGAVFDMLAKCVDEDGKIVLVCGDNLIGGVRIRTWRVLEHLLVRRRFTLFDRFRDPIGDRLLAPKRHGHKGLIKDEVVSAYRRSQ